MFDQVTGFNSSITTDGWPSRCPDPEQPVRLEIDSKTTVEFRWGPFWAFGSAAYWISQYLVRFGQAPIPNQALGRNLLEETAACILGGYGIPAELGMAAYRAVREAGLLRPGCLTSASAFEAVLSRPLPISTPQRMRTLFDCPRPVHYRFARQRAGRLEEATRAFAQGEPSLDCPVALRDWLLHIPGVGHKTASWIVRNHTGSSEVAIIDIHLHRAGLTAGFFLPDWTLPRDYLKFERAFLLYCGCGCVPASGVDALIWEEQRVVTTHCPLGSLSRHLPRADLMLALDGFGATGAATG